jgi:hypothetical protein
MVSSGLFAAGYEFVNSDVRLPSFAAAAAADLQLSCFLCRSTALDYILLVFSPCPTGLLDAG